MHGDCKKQQEHRQARHICTTTSLTAKGPPIKNLEKRKVIGFLLPEKTILERFCHILALQQS